MWYRNPIRIQNIADCVRSVHCVVIAETKRSQRIIFFRKKILQFVPTTLGENIESMYGDTLRIA